MRLSHSPLRSTDGFTLMELLAVLAIMALLASMAVPAYSRFMAGVRLDTACRAIVTEVRFAHQAAMTEFTRWRVVIELDGLRVESQDRTTAQYVIRRPVLHLPAGITFVEAVQGLAITANEIGELKSSPQVTSFGITNQYGERRYIRFERTGHITITVTTLGRISPSNMGSGMTAPRVFVPSKS